MCANLTGLESKTPLLQSKNQDYHSGAFSYVYAWYGMLGSVHACICFHCDWLCWCWRGGWCFLLMELKWLLGLIKSTGTAVWLRLGGPLRIRTDRKHGITEQSIFIFKNHFIWTSQPLTRGLLYVPLPHRILWGINLIKYDQHMWNKPVPPLMYEGHLIMAHLKCKSYISRVPA